MKAGYVGACPRRDRDCGIPDVFVTTEPVPVHPGGFLRINTKRHVRRLWMDLDCPHRRVKSSGNRLWLFELPDKGCTIGELLLTYRRLEVTYTFNLERHEHCRPDGSETVAENVFARIYTVEEVFEADGERDVETHFFACRLDSGISRYVGEESYPYSGMYYVEGVVLADERVAYVAGFADSRYENENRFTLSVLDTATMSFERQLRFEVPSPSNRDIRITGVVLKSNGSVAWILYRQAWDFSQTYEVWKSDASDEDGLLDSGPDIDPQSLALSGSTLFWMRAGEPQAATLD